MEKDTHNVSKSTTCKMPTNYAQRKRKVTQTLKIDDNDDNEAADLGEGGRVWFLEGGPDVRLDALPAGEVAGLQLVVEAELLHDVLVGRLVRVQLESVEDLQCLLRVAVCRVRHPAARLHLRQHQGGYIFYAGGSIAGVSCRRRWPPPTTLALTTLVAQCELSRR